MVSTGNLHDGMTPGLDGAPWRVDSRSGESPSRT